MANKNAAMVMNSAPTAIGDRETPDQYAISSTTKHQKRAGAIDAIASPMNRAEGPQSALRTVVSADEIAAVVADRMAASSTFRRVIH
ncbi:hypothetical protein HYPP_00800 [Hyphomicrobium sp. ghe19]|nr:hypothetical protein HYPP_00800 [Hyphomicrobium sp. ghe19]